MFNKTLEILKKKTKKIYFLLLPPPSWIWKIVIIFLIFMLPLKLNSWTPKCTFWYSRTEQIHIRLCLELAKIRKLIVIWRPSWICTIFQLKHTYSLNSWRSFCNVNTLDMIKYNNCVFVFISKSKISDLVIYCPVHHFEFLPPFWILVSTKLSQFDSHILMSYILVKKSSYYVK